mgnify:CR=1 FL=1
MKNFLVYAADVWAIDACTDVVERYRALAAKTTSERMRRKLGLRALGALACVSELRKIAKDRARRIPC